MFDRVRKVTASPVIAVASALTLTGALALVPSPASAQTADGDTYVSGRLSIVSVHHDAADPEVDESQPHSHEADVVMLETADGPVLLDSPDVPAGFEPGQLVAVRGTLNTDVDDPTTEDPTATADVLAVDAMAPMPTPDGTAATASATGSESVLVIPITWAGATGVDSQATLASRVPDLQNWYATASDSRLSLSFAVLNPLAVTPRASCTYWSMQTDAYAAAASIGYDATAYHHVIVVVPTSAGCGWAGLASVGGGSVWVNGGNAFSLHVVPHELGHNYALGHASRYDCVNGVRVSFGGTCDEIEYADRYSAMSAYSHGVFNVVEQSRVGWLTGGRAADITSGTYVLAPSSANGVTLKALRVAHPAGTLWISYRYPSSLDTSWGGDPNAPYGVEVHLTTPSDASYTDTRLIDLTPGGAPRAGTTDLWDRTLIGGQAWIDPQSRVRIDVNGTTLYGASVTVTDLTAFPPASITSASATAGVLSASATWTASNASAYLVWVNGVPHSWTTWLSHTVSGLAPVVTKLNVQPYNGGGVAGPLSADLWVLPTAPPPASVSSITVAPDITKAWASWTASNASAYLVWVDGVPHSWTSATSTVIPNLSPTVHKIQVQPYNAGGTAGALSTAGWVLPTPVPTVSVTGAVQASSPGTAYLWWNGTPSWAASRYLVYVDGQPRMWVPSLYVAIGGLPTGVHHLQIVAVNWAGQPGPASPLYWFST